MFKKKMTSSVLAVALTGTSITPLNVFADNSNTSTISQTLEQDNIVQKATVSRFDIYYSKDIKEYDNKFKMDNSNITSIKSAGGKLYANNGTENIIDGNLETYWETGRQSNFQNELTFTFDKATVLDRIAYRSAWNTVGFATDFEIWSSSTDNEEDFQLVSTGQANKTADFVEIQFKPTEFKRLKFVFKNSGTATASEMMFYKEDTLKDKIDRLFTNSKKNEVSEEFKDTKKLDELEKEAEEHPLYNTFKDEIDNARMILEGNNFNYTDAKVSTFLSHNDERLNAYDELFKVKRENITSITTNGGQYSTLSIDRAIDGDVDTQWHSGNLNNENFTNELVITLDKLTTIDRMTYYNKVSRGFAEAFEIYASKTSTGDTFEKITSGTTSINTKDTLEIKFKPTELRRIKLVFKKGYEDWALAFEIGLYKEDKVRDSINRLFTTSGMNEVSPEFNDIEKINELEKEAEKHPLYNQFKDTIQDAKEVVSGNIQNIKTVVAEQHGDRVAHANKNLKIGLGNNNQPTGVLALAGETITVYVDAEEGKPLPKLYFSQQDGSWANWGKTVQLKAGKNEIVVPKVTQEDGWYRHSVTPGGPIYIVNPYTEEEQGKAPTIRFAKGVQTFPIFDKNTNEEAFLQFLKDYKEKLDEDAEQNPDVMDRKMIDTFELVADHVVLTFTATSAYEAYIKGNFTPTKTLNMYNDHLDMLFKYQGLDNSSEKHSIKYTRENIRLAQPYGFMYAAGNHTGVQTPQLVELLTTVGGWGIDHEIGHRMDIGVRTLGEITNNMLPQQSANYYKTTAENRIPYETHVYKNVIGIGNNEYLKGGYFENLAAFWQLEMVYPGYWAKLNKLYREHNVTASNDNEKLDKLAYYSSMALNLDLTEYFERHGFPVTAATKEYAKQFDKPKNKIWYANETYLKYTGQGFSDNTTLEVSTIKHGDNIKVSFNVDDNSKGDVLGYEVYRGDELVAFTSTNSFIDTTVSYLDNVTYTIIPFDKKLNEGKAIKVNSYKPTIKVQQEELTLKLGEKFDLESIVSAFNYKGDDISSDIEVTSDVNTDKKGTYSVTYSVTNENLTTEKTITVTVVSDYAYLSDYKWESVETEYGTPRRNNSIKGRVNGNIKTFEKGFGIHANGKIVYDLSDKDYDTFEALLGVDMNIEAQNNSSITFKIIGDGKTLATTNVLKHADDMVYINVPVKGVNQLIIEVHDGGNRNASDHAVIANPKLTTTNAKPVLTVGDDESIEIRTDLDLMSSVKATDAEDGNLTESIIIDKNGFNPNKTGVYTIKYSVKDSDNNVTTAQKKVVVYSAEEYLSDLNWKSATIGSGYVGKDKAVSGNAIRLLNEDNTIETYKKGIGTHSYSEIVYDSQGYDALDTWVGIDQHVADKNSSVIFKVYVDGTLKAETDIMRPGTPKERLVVDIRNSKEVKLVVDVAENGNNWDHADWADIKFLKFNTAPTLNIPNSISTKVGHKIDLNQKYSASDIEDGDLTDSVQVSGNVNFDKTGEYPLTYTVSDSDGNTVTKTRTVAVVDMNDFDYLTKLDWKSETHTYAAPKKDISTSSNTLRLTGKDGEVVSYSKGLGTHSKSTIIYDLSDKNYDYFTSYVGVDRQMYNTVGSVSFEVYVDGEKKFDSGLMKSTDPQKYLEVDINGAKELKLVVTDGGNGNGSDHATWGDTKLHYANENGISIDRIALDNLIQEVNKLNSEDYQKESFDNLKTVLVEVSKELDNGYDQEEIDTLYTELKSAYDSLILALDFSKLEELINKNTEINELNYHKDDILAHKAVIEEAQAILGNEEVTQDTINEMVNKLTESYKNLKPRENKVELLSKIEEAKLVKNENFIDVRWENYLWSIDYATNIYNNIDATDEDISSALFMLQYSYEELK